MFTERWGLAGGCDNCGLVGLKRRARRDSRAEEVPFRDGDDVGLNVRGCRADMLGTIIQGLYGGRGSGRGHGVGSVPGAVFAHLWFSGQNGGRN